MASCGEWLEGQYVLDANKTVTMKLDELGALLNLTFITHAYPHDWRTKNQSSLEQRLSGLLLLIRFAMNY